VEAIHRARSFGGDATVLADYALTTTNNSTSHSHACVSHQAHIIWYRSKCGDVPQLRR